MVSDKSLQGYIQGLVYSGAAKDCETARELLKRLARSAEEKTAWTPADDLLSLRERFKELGIGYPGTAARYIQLDNLAANLDVFPESSEIKNRVLGAINKELANLRNDEGREGISDEIMQLLICNSVNASAMGSKVDPRYFIKRIEALAQCKDFPPPESDNSPASILPA